MLQFMRAIHAKKDEKGASAVEYGLLVAAIAALIVLVVFVIGHFVQGAFNNTCAGMEGEVAGVADTCP